MSNTTLVALVFKYVKSNYGHYRQTNYLLYINTLVSKLDFPTANSSTQSKPSNHKSIELAINIKVSLYIRIYTYLKTCSNRHTRCLTQPTSTTYGPSSQNCHACLVLLAVEPKVIQWNAKKLGGIVIYLIRIRQLQQK